MFLCVVVGTVVLFGSAIGGVAGLLLGGVAGAWAGWILLGCVFELDAGQRLALAVSGPFVAQAAFAAGAWMGGLLSPA